jgi:lysine biosynthesis protein LysW
MDCLECGAALVLAPDVQVGDRVTCPACGEAFEVVEVEPFEIDYPDEDWEDWADEDWDLDEDDEPDAG